MAAGKAQKETVKKSLPLTSAKELPDICAVYFVVDSSGKVLYVGATKALGRRWRTHSRKKDFAKHNASSIEWESVSPRRLGRVEQDAIERLRPILNTSLIGYRLDATGPLSKDVHVYFPPKVLADLKKLAEQNRRSVTAEIVIAVEERLESAKNGSKAKEKR